MDFPPGKAAGSSDEQSAGAQEPLSRVTDDSGLAGISGAQALIVVCDHAGHGWEQQADALRDQGLQVELTHSLRETVDRLDREPRPNLLIVDPLSGGGTVELAVLESHRSENPASSTPIPLLMIVEREGEEPILRADRALPSGHWDLLRREASVTELELRARRLLDQARTIDEMELLRHRALYDDRTELLRPLAFEARLKEHFSAAQRHDHDIALVLIDLDRFGQINKEHDHTIGDAIIGLVGGAIREALRTEDVAGRLGGDEFAVILPYTRKIDAAHVVNRLREEIKKLSGRPHGAKSNVAVSGSIGFETFDGKDIESHESLRNHAEQALRASKVAGGNRATYYRSLPSANAPEVSAVPPLD